jgi:hypothetical protein
MSEVWAQFGNPEERERLPLEAVTGGGKADSGD